MIAYHRSHRWTQIEYEHQTIASRQKRDFGIRGDSVDVIKAIGVRIVFIIIIRRQNRNGINFVVYVKMLL